jgi:hypothetical protein
LDGVAEFGMPLLRYFALAGSALLGLLLLAEPYFGPPKSLTISTSFHGLPAPFREARPSAAAFAGVATNAGATSAGVARPADPPGHAAMAAAPDALKQPSQSTTDGRGTAPRPVSAETPASVQPAPSPITTVAIPATAKAKKPRKTARAKPTEPVARNPFFTPGPNLFAQTAPQRPGRAFVR